MSSSTTKLGVICGLLIAAGIGCGLVGQERPAPLTSSPDCEPDLVVVGDGARATSDKEGMAFHLLVQICGARDGECIELPEGMEFVVKQNDAEVYTGRGQQLPSGADISFVTDIHPTLTYEEASYVYRLFEELLRQLARACPEDRLQLLLVHPLYQPHLTTDPNLLANLLWNYLRIYPRESDDIGKHVREVIERKPRQSYGRQSVIVLLRYHVSPLHVEKGGGLHDALGKATGQGIAVRLVSLSAGAHVVPETGELLEGLGVTTYLLTRPKQIPDPNDAPYDLSLPIVSAMEHLSADLRRVAPRYLIAFPGEGLLAGSTREQFVEIALSNGSEQWTCPLRVPIAFPEAPHRESGFWLIIAMAILSGLAAAYPVYVLCVVLRGIARLMEVAGDN